MDNKKSIPYLVCILIVALDVTAGILGIEAEIAAKKVRTLRAGVGIECKDPNQAFKLALAAVFLSCCSCIWSRQELEVSSNKDQLVARFISWFTYFLSFNLLMSWVVTNNRSRQICWILPRKYALSVGGVLCFLHGLFAVGYYVATAINQEEHNHKHPVVPAATA